MKKFVKYGTIAGCVMILTGMGISTASFAMGADLRRIGNFIENRFVGAGEEKYRELRERAEETVREARITPEFSDQTESFSEEYSTVTELKILQFGGSGEIHTMPDIDTLTVKSSRDLSNKLIFKDTERKKELIVRADDDMEYEIIIPDTWELGCFDAEVTDGNLNGSGLRALVMELDASQGDISVSQETGASVEITCNNGTISWTCKDPMVPNVEADCLSGEIYLTVPEHMDLSLCGYDIECKNGTVIFPDFAVEGWGEKRSVAEKGMPFFELETENGQITVEK